jgi:hypothetical protein
MIGSLLDLAHGRDNIRISAATAYIPRHSLPDLAVTQLLEPVWLTALGMPERHSSSIATAEQIWPEVLHPH